MTDNTEDSVVREEKYDNASVNTEESFVRDSNELTQFDRLTSFTAFLLGLFMNCGSFNIMGFMMGMNYQFFMQKSNMNRIYMDLQTVFPSFVLGVFLVNIYIPYFVCSVVMGYMYKKKQLKIPRNVINVVNKIPKDYRTFGNRNEFLRSIFGIVNENEKENKKEE